MGLGASLFLIAGGAILIWGVTGEVAGLDVDAIGAILMVIGIIGLILSMIFWSSWGGFGGRRRATYVEEGPPPVRRLKDELSTPGWPRAAPGCLERRLWVDGRAPDEHLEMQVRAGGLTRCSDEAYACAGRDMLSELHVDSREMRVQRPDTGAVLDDDEVPPAAGVPAGKHYEARAGGGHRRAGRSREVEATVKPPASRTEERLRSEPGAERRERAESEARAREAPRKSMLPPCRRP